MLMECFSSTLFLHQPQRTGFLARSLRIQGLSAKPILLSVLMSRFGLSIPLRYHYSVAQTQNTYFTQFFPFFPIP
jgi:hypothetical protein